MKRLLIIIIFFFSCGEKIEECTLEKEKDYLHEDGFVLSICQCQYRPPPENETTPWSKCKSNFRTLYFCIDDLLWCPYDEWGWRCADSYEEIVNGTCGTL